MIRINLLGVPKPKKGKRQAVAVAGEGPNPMLVGVVVLVLAAAGMGVWWWLVDQDGKKIAEVQSDLIEKNAGQLAVAVGLALRSFETL